MAAAIIAIVPALGMSSPFYFSSVFSFDVFVSG
jgi:hypothetical protein